MKDNVKRVFYVRYVAHPCYLDIIAQRPEIRLDKLENETADEVAQPIMAAAHACQIGSARDELKPRFHVQRDLLAGMPNLLIVSTNGAGFDTVNVKDCTEAGVLVVNQTGGNAEAVATHVLAMVLMLSKQIVQTNHALRRGAMGDRTAFMGNDVKGRTIGIVGIGNVGRRVAELCRGLLGMQVIACDPYLDEQTIAARGAVKVDLDELLRRADFVSINCPLDEGTRGMIGAREFALMQPHAYFITTARGFIHDEGALAEALRAKQIAGTARSRPPAVAIRQRDRDPAHGGHDARGARQYGAHRRRATRHDARRQTPAPHRQPAGVAGLCQAVRADLRVPPGELAPPTCTALMSVLRGW
jgi:D-3-phosphoglycerate dehydrogenase / 2-oxoglutarate reductase